MCSVASCGSAPGNQAPALSADNGMWDHAALTLGNDKTGEKPTGRSGPTVKAPSFDFGITVGTTFQQQLTNLSQVAFSHLQVLARGMMGMSAQASE